LRFLLLLSHENEPLGGFFARAVSVLRSVSILFPTRLKVIEHSFDDRSGFRSWLIDDNTSSSSNNNKDAPFRTRFSEASAQQHSSSPFVWFCNSEDMCDIDCYLGGHDDTLNWCRKFLEPAKESAVAAAPAKSIHVDDGHKPDHGFDYDLVVVGGGSGGMAAAKEAAQNGAKVACLDFVKPSPIGTTWGLGTQVESRAVSKIATLAPSSLTPFTLPCLVFLGGTCVNVGCIPKKLFHAGSLIRESIQVDSAAYGIRLGGTNSDNDGDIPEPKTTVQWDVLRENIQNYIRSLNFKYRVRLREKNVSYLNKLAKFVDKNTIEATDKKGNVSRITSSRFLIAVGGRPSPLSCEGAELAISSDDVFSLEQSPGKTLCVGASYISLECAGFLHGIGLDVTVSVRSILLRGFDRECSDKIGKLMEDGGIKFKREVVPNKLTKTASGQIHVTFSDGSEDTYDTVLAAVGRFADTEKLGIDKLGVKVNPKNQRIIGKYEQTGCPNVYAVGDVLDVSTAQIYVLSMVLCTVCSQMPVFREPRN
jgi:thioredoxin reductase (NADPH)